MPPPFSRAGSCGLFPEAALLSQFMKEIIFLLVISRDHRYLFFLLLLLIDLMNALNLNDEILR